MKYESKLIRDVTLLHVSPWRWYIPDQVPNHYPMLSSLRVGLVSVGPSERPPRRYTSQPPPCSQWCRSFHRQRQAATLSRQLHHQVFGRPSCVVFRGQMQNRAIRSEVNPSRAECLMQIKTKSVFVHLTLFIPSSLLFYAFMGAVMMLWSLWKLTIPLTPHFMLISRSLNPCPVAAAVAKETANAKSVLAATCRNIGGKIHQQNEKYLALLANK